MLLDIHNSAVRDNIENNRLIELPDPIRRVIDCREFQRLRHIRQMGLASYVFPTAEHSRFVHSVGVYGVALDAFRILQHRSQHFDLHTPGIKFDEHAQFEFCIAALCHDIGHTAFSHVLETVLLPDGFRNHEDCTRAILQDTRISKVIDDVADLEAVVYLLDKRHPNKALNDLISSAFDVDRCDYVLRDSAMSGVEYGKFDLKWLLHAITIELNSLQQPVLLLDGPRGLDALRQFLSARRYMHRQVYYHPTVRGAQLLLKGIFDRIQDIGAHGDTKRLAPACLHPIMDGKKLSLGDFLRATDFEVLYMIMNFADEHSDPVLKLLASMFVERNFPKCAFDSAKSNSPFDVHYRVDVDDAEPEPQYELIPRPRRVTGISFTREIQEFIARKLEAGGSPAEAAKYLVALDHVTFRSGPPTDLLFSFKGEIVPLENINRETVGFDLLGLLEGFSITRVYVPQDLIAATKEHMENNYKLE